MKIWIFYLDDMENMDSSRNKYFYCFRWIGRTGQLSAIKLSKGATFYQTNFPETSQDGEM